MRILLLILSIYILTSCGAYKKNNNQLIEKYRIRIGCTNYGSLRLAEGNYDEIIKRVQNDLASQKSISTTKIIVFKSLNKDILFIHLSFKEQNKMGVANYLFDLNTDNIVGYYLCN